MHAQLRFIIPPWLLAQPLECADTCKLNDAWGATICVDGRLQICICSNITAVNGVEPGHYFRSANDECTYRHEETQLPGYACLADGSLNAAPGQLLECFEADAWAVTLECLNNIDCGQAPAAERASCAYARCVEKEFARRAADHYTFMCNDRRNGGDLLPADVLDRFLDLFYEQATDACEHIRPRG